MTVSEPTPTPSLTPEPTPSPAPEPQVLHGDIDCDGDIDVMDALVILRMVAGLPVPPPTLAEGCPTGGG